MDIRLPAAEQTDRRLHVAVQDCESVKDDVQTARRFVDVDEATAPLLQQAMEAQDAADPTLYHLQHMQVSCPILQRPLQHAFPGVDQTVLL